MSSVMDLNASPLPEEDEEYFEQHSAEDVTPHGHESSVETLHREREERRQRMRSDLVDDRPVRKNRRPLDQDEGPQLKKFKSDRNKLPSGWLDCPNFGQEIAFIIPSKVPLDESFNIPPGKRYSFSRVLERVKNFKVGMVVDLTNTDRYYSTRDFKNKGVKYLKIRCQGRDAVPDNEAVNTFVFEVSQYILNQPKMQPKKHVFVHCTHGHNRTGYMIVNYLMRTQQATSVTEAIQRFSKSRPPGIYKQDYIDSLYAFYHEAKPELVVCPSTPEWKRSADFDLNGEALPEDDDGVSYAPINEKQENIILMTNDDVLGDKIPDDQEVQFRRFCFEMLLLRLPEPTRGKSKFPGSHPVSLDRENLQLLRQRYYYATWKADGTRYMLLLSPDGCYLVDRSFKFRRVQMRFPCKDRVKCHHFTLLDGEMIIDTIGPQKQERRYLIYDLIALNRVSMIEWPFYERWKMIDKEIIEPRYHDRDHPKAPYRYDLEPFRVRRKDFWLLSTARKLLKDLIPKLSHEADGLIFQGWDDPYVPRTHEGLLKWKYPEMNSVDFLFEIREDGAECLYLHEQGKKRLMDNNGVVFGDAFEPASSYSGKIIECSWDSEENVWVCMRVRVDKSTPNDFNTYKKVMKSIKDNITEEVLLNEIDEIISLPMYADRIQIDSRSQKKGKQPPK